MVSATTLLIAFIAGCAAGIFAGLRLHSPGKKPR
jgi:hypothetical protein